MARRWKRSTLHPYHWFETFPFPAGLTPADTAHQRTETLPGGEVTPLGMDHSPYPDRILPKLSHEKDLAERTLTTLYSQRPAWLDAAHKALDMAVAQAYGWSDYTADMADEEILKRLLALNMVRAGGAT